MSELVPAAERVLRFFRERFLNREDVVAILAPWGKPCPVEGNGSLEKLLLGHVLGSGAPEAKVSYANKRGSGAIKGHFRVGSYCPAPDGSTRWLCLDFDGAGHAEALADAEMAAKTTWKDFEQLELSAYLERSGGGHGWHLWCFFDPPIPAEKAQQLGRALAPTDALLTHGGFANATSGRGIEVFPKQKKIRKGGFGNLVWLPWWSHAKHGGCTFYKSGDNGEVTPFVPDHLETVTPERVENVLTAIQNQADNESGTQHLESDPSWLAWRKKALAALPLESIYGDWLTGESAGTGWLQCRDPESPTGDQHPSASVADGSGQAERGAFHSFITGDTMSVFDFLVKYKIASDFRDARAQVAKMSGSPEPCVPSKPKRSRSNRPMFEYKISEGHVAVMAAVKALSRDPIVYQRGQALVTAVPDRTHPGDPGSYIISAVSQPRVWELLSARMAWTKYDGRSKRVVPCEPPDRVVSAVHRRSAWPGVRPLNGITAVPVLRPDGEVHDTRGYDAETGLLYVPNGSMPRIVRKPSHDDAVSAAKTLLDVVCDFPFVGDTHRAAWIAALLSPIARPAYRGGTPFFLFDAHTPGTGKTLLCDAIGLIVSGRRMVHSPYVAEDEEMRKRITAHAMAGDSLVLIDNAPSGTLIGWPSLDNALTSDNWSDRILGRSEVVSLPLNIVWYTTGNNIGVRADAARRSLQIRLEAQQERPETRTGFRHNPLLGWIREQRAQLLGAALTLLRAYFVAGRPTHNLESIGSFDGWSNIVREAIVWAGLDDPVEACMSRNLDADPDRPAHTQALLAWRDMTRDGVGLTAADALAKLDAQPALGRVLSDLCSGKSGALPTARVLSRKLRVLRGRWRLVDVSGEKKSLSFAHGPKRARGGIVRWIVEEKSAIG